MSVVASAPAPTHFGQVGGESNEGFQEQKPAGSRCPGTSDRLQHDIHVCIYIHTHIYIYNIVYIYI